MMRGGGDDDNNGTHYLPPASRATARGVGRGWNDDNTHDSTLDHRHKPLLVGWKGGAREVWMTSGMAGGWGGAFFNFSIFCPLISMVIIN